MQSAAKTGRRRRTGGGSASAGVVGSITRRFWREAERARSSTLLILSRQLRFYPSLPKCENSRAACRMKNDTYIAHWIVCNHIHASSGDMSGVQPINPDSFNTISRRHFTVAFVGSRSNRLLSNSQFSLISILPGAGFIWKN